MTNYVRPLSGYYLNMFLLVLHTLHLLVFTRGSRVIDAYNQAVQNNKYCSKIGECLPGTHVMCMYGNTTVMNPKCAEGKVLTLDDTERDLFLEIFNGFRRDLASGKEVLGKDGVRLPQARNMRKLLWDTNLETFAQAWANQCQVRRNQCHSTDQYPRAGQMVGISRFTYPDWGIQKQKLKDSGPSLERRKYAIQDFAGEVFSARKHVTLSMTQELIGSVNRNVYLMSVYGPSSHIGCAMSSFVEFQLTQNRNYNYAVIVVCNFSSRPQINEPIYMTNGSGPCSCFEGFKNESCLCVPGNDDINNRDNESEDIDTPVQNDGTIEEPESRNSEKGRCPAVASLMAVLPILDVHDADLTKQLHEFQDLNSTTIAQKRQQLRKKIKERLQNARDHYFCKHGRELGNRFIDGAPVDQNSFLKSEFGSDFRKSNVNRKQRDLNLAIPTNLHLQIKPKLDVSDMNQHLLHNHHVIKDNSRTDETNRLFNDMRNTAPAKVYVTSINGKPVKHPFENFQKTQRLRTLSYGRQGFSNQEPNVFITSINGNPVKYHYDDQFKKSQKTSTRDLSYEVKGFNHNESPYTAISNEDLDHLISGVYAGDQELKDMWHDRYINELVQKVMRRNGEKTTNMDNILVTKQKGKGDLTNSSSFKVFATDNSDPLTINSKEKNIQTKIDNWLTRNQMMQKHDNHNERKSQTEKGNQIIKKMKNSAAAKVYVTSLNGKPVKYPVENIPNSQRVSTKTLPYHAESKIYISSINGKPKKYKNLQNPGTRVLSYEEEGLNDKGSPYIISNDDHEPLGALFSQVQELKDILYNSYINEMDHKKMRTTGESNILITKQTGDFTDNTGSEFVANNNDPSNFHNEPKTIETEIGNWPIKNQNHNGDDSLTEAENRIFNDMSNTAATKVYVTFVNGEPVKYPLENNKNSNTRKFPYGEQGISNQGERKIDIINDGKGKPEKYYYDEKLKNIKTPITRVLSYDEKGLNYKKSPYTNIPNDDLNQLLSYLLNNYIHEMENKNLRTIGKDITNKDYITTNEQIEKNVKGRGSKVSAKDNNDPLNIDNEPKIIKTQNNNWLTRHQVPLHIHAYGTNNFDYFRHFHATKEFVKPRATLINNENKNEQYNANDASIGVSPGKHRLNDCHVNKIVNYYTYMLKHME